MGIVVLLVVGTGSGAEAAIRHVSSSVDDVTLVPSGGSIVRVYGQFSSRKEKCKVKRAVTVKRRSGGEVTTFGGGVTTFVAPESPAAFDITGDQPNSGAYDIIFARKSYTKGTTTFICNKLTHTVNL